MKQHIYKSPPQHKIAKEANAHIQAQQSIPKAPHKERREEAAERFGHSLANISLENQNATIPIQNKRILQAKNAAQAGNTSTQSKGVLQRVLMVDMTDDKYVTLVRRHLNELVGDGATVSISPRTGLVKLHTKNKKKATAPGYRLIQSLISHSHATVIRSAQGPDQNRSQPNLPDNSLAGKALDYFKGTQWLMKKGFLTHQARAFVHGSTPGVGVGTTVYYDANMSSKDREGYVRNEDGSVEREVAPQSITLGHELIHSDHFHKGLAAYDQRGLPIKGSTEHTFTKNRGHLTNLEEINTVGLPPLPVNHNFHQHVQTFYAPTMHEQYQPQLTKKDIDSRVVTEQDLRDQLKLKPRAGYER